MQHDQRFDWEKLIKISAYTLTARTAAVKSGIFFFYYVLLMGQGL